MLNSTRFVFTFTPRTWIEIDIYLSCLFFDLSLFYIYFKHLNNIKTLVKVFNYYEYVLSSNKYSIIFMWNREGKGNFSMGIGGKWEKNFPCRYRIWITSHSHTEDKGEDGESSRLQGWIQKIGYSTPPYLILLPSQSLTLKLIASNLV